MAINQQITSAPPAPQRSDPNTFADKADAFVAWLESLDDELNQWANECNDTESNINNIEQIVLQAKDDAITAKDLAVAEANAQVYDSSTIYNYPDCVIGSDGFVYRCMGSNVQGDDPVTSTSGNWKALTISTEEVEKRIFGVSKEINLDSSDINLTDNDNGIIVVISASEDYCIKLDNATNFDSLGNKFVILNKTSIPILVRNYLGGLLTVVLPEDTAKIILADNTTDHGRWIIHQNKPIGAWVYQGHSFDGVRGVSWSNYGFDKAFSVAIDSNKFLHIYKDTNDGYLKATVFQVNSDRTISQLVSPVSVTNFEIDTYLSACKLSSTEFFVFFRKYDTSTHDYSYYGAVLLWDGSTLSIKVSATQLVSVSNLKYRQISCDSISGSEVFVGYYDGNDLRGAIVSYDGNSLTLKTSASTGQDYSASYCFVENESSLWIASYDSFFHFSYDGTNLTYDTYKSSNCSYIFKTSYDKLIMYSIYYSSSTYMYSYFISDMLWDGNQIKDSWSIGLGWKDNSLKPFSYIINNNILIFINVHELKGRVLVMSEDYESLAVRRFYPIVGKVTKFQSVLPLNENILIDTTNLAVIELTQLAYPDVVKSGV